VQAEREDLLNADISTFLDPEIEKIKARDE